MGHLSSTDFVDLLEGVRGDEAAPHLAECDRCRRELADLREMLTTASSADMPEPSPLFWNHLSARVQEAVAQEGLISERPGRTSLLGNWWIRAATGVAASVLVIAALVTLGSRPGVPPPSARVQLDPPALPASADDGPFGLVADFGGTLEWDDLREQMAVSAYSGRLDGGVGELNSGERRELERLLKEELARPAARTDRS
jgi:hypothetical protein